MQTKKNKYKNYQQSRESFDVELIQTLGDLVAQQSDRLNQLEAKLNELSAELSRLSTSTPTVVEASEQTSQDHLECDHQYSGLSTASLLRNWENQETPAICPESTLEPERMYMVAPKVEKPIPMSLVERPVSELAELPGVTPEDLELIQSLKDQLQQMLRTTEVELSIERAKMSQERMALEQLAANLDRQQREIEAEKNTKKEPVSVVGRMKRFLVKNKNQGE